MQKPPDKRRTRWVRLADVPEQTRLRAAVNWIRAHDEPLPEAVDLIALAIAPGNAGGWVAK